MTNQLIQNGAINYDVLRQLTNAATIALRDAGEVYVPLAVAAYLRTRGVGIVWPGVRNANRDICVTAQPAWRENCLNNIRMAANAAAVSEAA